MKAYSFLFGKGVAQTMKTLKEICGDSRTPNKYVRFETATLPKLPRKPDGAILRNAVELGDPRVYIYASHTYGDGLHQISVYTAEGLALSFYIYGDMPMAELTNDEIETAKPVFQKGERKNLNLRLVHQWYSGTDQALFLEDGSGKLLPASLFLADGEKEIVAHYKSIGTEGMPNGQRGSARNLGDERYAGVGGAPLFHSGMRARLHTRPFGCMESHTNSIAASFRGLLDAARKDYPKARVSVKTTMDLPAGIVPETFMHTQKDCLNVYGIKPRTDVSFQIGEFNYHFGLANITKEQVVPMIKAADAIIGVALVSLLSKYDDPRRRLVSLPGDHMLRAGRVEYKTMSNAVFCHPMISYLTVDVLRKALVLGRDGYFKYWETSDAEVINTMMDMDVDQARKILVRNKECFEKLLFGAYRWLWSDPNGGLGRRADADKRADVLFSIFMNGVDSVIEDPTNVTDNWTMNDYATWRNLEVGRKVYYFFENLSHGEKNK